MDTAAATSSQLSLKKDRSERDSATPMRQDYDWRPFPARREMVPSSFERVIMLPDENSSLFAKSTSRFSVDPEERESSSSVPESGDRSPGQHAPTARSLYSGTIALSSFMISESEA